MHRFEAATGLLYPSTATFTSPPSLVTTLILRILALFGLVKVQYSKDGRTIISTTNLTIINTVLCICGPLREDRLTMAIMAIQAAGSVLAFAIRYAGAGLFYDERRR